MQKKKDSTFEHATKYQWKQIQTTLHTLMSRQKEAKYKNIHQPSRPLSSHQKLRKNKLVSKLLNVENALVKFEQIISSTSTIRRNSTIQKAMKIYASDCVALLEPHKHKGW
ncbi:hypothetical protein ACB098_08G102600 [Castanea mollissima]